MTSDTLLRPDAAVLHDRLLALWERTGDATLGQLAGGRLPAADAAGTVAQPEHWLSTGLMTAFRDTGDGEVFALLFELNREGWLRAIKHRLRGGCIDPDDVLQEVALNMMRYPQRFAGDRADALRKWSHGIIRNTLATLARGELRRPLSIDQDDAAQPQDHRTGTPERCASLHEDAGIVDRAYLLFLALYLAHFERLPRHAQRILTGVEVEGRSYRELADAARLPVTNLKMVVFRSRRRIFRGMAESLAALERQEPALEPLPRGR